MNVKQNLSILFYLKRKRKAGMVKVLSNVAKTGIFNRFNTSKIIALILLFISLLGSGENPMRKLNLKQRWLT